MTKNIFRAGLGIMASMMFASTAFAGSTNMLVNASFEDPPVPASGEYAGATGWGAFGGVFTIGEFAGGATLAAHDGVQYLKVFGTAGVTQQFSVAADDLVTASAWVFNDSNDAMGPGQIAAVNIEWFVSPGVAAMSGPDAIVSFGSSISGDTAVYPIDTWIQLGVFGAAVPTGDNGLATIAQITIITGPFGMGGVGGAPKFDDAFFGVETAVVPIPGALLLMGPALLGLMGFSRKKVS